MRAWSFKMEPQPKFARRFRHFDRDKHVKWMIPFPPTKYCGEKIEVLCQSRPLRKTRLCRSLIFIHVQDLHWGTIQQNWTSPQVKLWEINNSAIQRQPCWTWTQRLSGRSSTLSWKLRGQVWLLSPCSRLKKTSDWVPAGLNLLCYPSLYKSFLGATICKLEQLTRVVQILASAWVRGNISVRLTSIFSAWPCRSLKLVLEPSWDVDSLRFRDNLLRLFSRVSLPVQKCEWLKIKEFSSNVEGEQCRVERKINWGRWTSSWRRHSWRKI